MDSEFEAFGHWLSGFVDGEGCFYLESHPRRSRQDWHRRAVFSISSRADDKNILEDVRAFLGCGNLFFGQKRASGRTQIITASGVPRRIMDKPSWCYRVYDPLSLALVIVPHEERFPLRSKKASHSVVIWREAVLVWEMVSSQPSSSSRNGKYIPKWTEEEARAKDALAARLKAAHAYDPRMVGLPPPPTKQ